MTSGHTTAPYAYGYTNLSTTTYHPEQGKALSSKALAGAASANPELAIWYDQAHAYYNAVLNGSEAQPDPASWNEFLAQMSWAQAQLGGNAYGGGAWGDAGMNGGSYQPAPQPDPFGGMAGTQGNYVYTEEEARIGFTGDGVRDIWSNEVNIDVAPLSATVVAETTTDTRSQPPEEVIRITVTDPATGTEAVYYIHDFADANIHVNTPAVSQVTDHTGGLIEVGKFRKNGGNASDEVNVPFEEQDNGDLLVEVPYGETVNFTPQGGGEDQIWDVYGHFNLSVKPSDIVRVSQNPGDGYVITVEHKDGSFDTYKIHEDFHGNINGYPQNVFWGDPQNGGGIGEEIPGEIRGDITLNSAGGNEGSDKPSTPPDRTEDQTAIYDSSANVDLYADFDDNLKEHQITAPGEVIIHGSSYADTVEVLAGPRPGTYRILVHKAGSTAAEDTETYIVDGASKIVLDFLPEKITGEQAGDPIISKGSGDYVDESNSDDLQVAEQLTNLSGIEMSSEEILAEANERDLDLTTQSVPTEKLYQFLIEIDPVLAGLLRDFNAGNGTQRDVLFSQIRDRVVSLFQIIFPNAGVSAVAGDGHEVDDIMFGTEKIDIIDQDFNSNNHRVGEDELYEIFSFRDV